MKRVIRTLVAAVLAMFVTAPVFAQVPAQPGNRAARQQRLTPEQRRTMRRSMPARGARMRRAFKRLDTDRNGAISRQEWTRRPEVFDRLDANKDGQLTREELRQARRRR